MAKKAKITPQEKIKTIRKSWNMNQSQFGETIGKSLRSIQCYEDGTTPVPVAVDRLIDFIAKEREALTLKEVV
jgi:DNA-binding transcriptional regulator YiaG